MIIDIKDNGEIYQYAEKIGSDVKRDFTALLSSGNKKIILTLLLFLAVIALMFESKNSDTIAIVSIIVSMVVIWL